MERTGVGCYIRRMTALRARVSHGDPGDFDNVVRLHDVSWADYERLLRMRGDRSAPRITYLKGEVEIMSPSRSHESIKSFIGRLVETYCLENDIDFIPVGAWTLKEKAKERGAEPDECYLFGGGHPDATRPHLAIEVEWTSGRIDKLEVYRKLRSSRRSGTTAMGEIKPYVLRGERYRPVASSKVLPGIDLAEIVGLLVQPTAKRRDSFLPCRAPQARAEEGRGLS